MSRIGTDIVEVARIARAIANWQLSFLERVFTAEEMINIDIADPNIERAAGFWAAKESMVKALGYGFRDGIRFQDISVTHDAFGCPGFKFSGRVKEILAEKGITDVCLSISHCRSYATAVTFIS
ncbi:MAG TPA: holo-ACP synthase [Buttiauxella sp.]|jgi:holo-[acyl-carrier protein] synthase